MMYEDWTLTSNLPVQYCRSSPCRLRVVASQVTVAILLTHTAFPLYFPDGRDATMAATAHRPHQERKGRRRPLLMHVQGHHCPQATDRGRDRQRWVPHGRLPARSAENDSSQEGCNLAFGFWTTNGRSTILFSHTCTYATMRASFPETAPQQSAQGAMK